MSTLDQPAAPGAGAQDPLAVLRAATRARVALGRAGDALPTARLLDLRAAHAVARDAVHSPLDVEALTRDLGGFDLDVLHVASAAPDRATYLKRPDLGRVLAEGTDLPRGEYDVAILLADGLSPPAIRDHGVGMVAALLQRLDGWSIAPLVIGTQARVALGDHVAAALGARSVLVLVGERPGMSSTDSLGLYLTYDPRAGRRDSERNCLSNIRPPHGAGYEESADLAVMLLTEAHRLKLSGVSLKADPALES